MDPLVQPIKRGREREEKVTAVAHLLGIQNPSLLQSTSGILLSITRMGPIKEFPHGDGHIRSHSLLAKS